MKEPNSREDKVKLLKKIARGVIRISEIEPEGEVWIEQGDNCYNTKTLERTSLTQLMSRKNSIILLPDNYRD
jgi:hypothetical protein